MIGILYDEYCMMSTIKWNVVYMMYVLDVDTHIYEGKDPVIVPPTNLGLVQQVHIDHYMAQFMQFFQYICETNNHSATNWQNII